VTAVDEADARRALVDKLLRAEDVLRPEDAVVDLVQLEGGWSRYSHVATVRSADGAERRFVVRVKAPVALFDTDLVVEFDILSGLEGLDVPTPRVYGLHEKENPFGGELFIMEHLSGRSFNTWRAKDNAILAADWENGRGLAQDVVAALVGIHSVGPDAAPPALPRVTFEGQAQRWQQEYRDADLVRDPVMEAAFDWMADHVPAEERIGLVHGDYRMGNMLAEGGRISAILDWELAYLGDVRFDIGYLALPYIAGKHLRAKTQLLGGVADSDWFYAEYERLSGFEVDREAVRAFSVLGAISLMTMVHTGARRYVDGGTRDIRRVWARYGLAGLRQDLADLMGW
jgi:aminoglycoside phosphotransferase (APT) family kinase protein